MHFSIIVRKWLFKNEQFSIHKNAQKSHRFLFQYFKNMIQDIAKTPYMSKNILDKLHCNLSENRYFENYRNLSNFTFFTNIFLFWYSSTMECYKNARKIPFIRNQSHFYLIKAWLMQLASPVLLAEKTSGKLSMLDVNRPDRSPQEFLILSRESRLKVSTACDGGLNWQLYRRDFVSLFSLDNVSKKAVSSLRVFGICTLLAVILQRSYICLSVPLFLLALSRRFNPLTRTRITVEPSATNSETGLGDYHTNSAGPHASNVARHTHASGSVCGICGFSETPELNFN